MAKESKAFIVVMKRGESGDEYAEALRAIALRNRRGTLDCIFSDESTDFGLLRRYAEKIETPFRTIPADTKLPASFMDMWLATQGIKTPNLAYVTKGQCSGKIYDAVQGFASHHYEVTLKYL